MAADLMIYWASGVPQCMAALIVLEEKNLQGYKHKLLSFDKKEHKSEEVLKLNPRGEVPTFCHGDVVVNDSMAICDYLEAVFKDRGAQLLPAEPAKLAEVLQRRYEVPNLQKKGFDDLVRFFSNTKEEDIDKDLLKQRQEAFTNELQVWEGYLEKQSADGGFLCGAFSAADISMFPILAFYVRVGLQLKGKRPALHAYYNRMCERASVKAAWPPHWKDTEGKDMLAKIFPDQ